MSVRFVIGRAGSGKTWWCLEQLRARLRQNALDGHKLLLIVPEQASFQMERALIETPDISGFVRCEVLSFQRLAYRIFSQTGADPRQTDQTIGGLGRLMVLRRLIRQHQNELQLLTSVADRPGVVKQVSSALNELMHEEVSASKLAELSQEMAAENPLGAAKLGDLARLYTAYLDYLVDDRLDPAQYLDMAAERLPRCEWLTGAEVWVDGFAGFTQQEYQLLAGLAQHAHKLEITLLMDPSASAIDKDDLPGLSYSLFTRTERTLIRLKRTFAQAGVEMDKPFRLSDSGQSRFFAPELQQLENRLFSSGTKNISDSEAPEPPESVRVFSFPDRRTEVEAAVAEIHRLTHVGDQPLRFRDIAVIVRDLDAYHDLLAATMQGQRIPFFIDRRRPTSHHPLVELVRGLLSMAADDCRLDSVRLLLKTSLLPMSNEEGDLLENYLLAHGLQGRSAWTCDWPYTRMFSRHSANNELNEKQKAVLQRINRIRQNWLDMFDPWLEQATECEQATGRQWAEHVYKELEHLQVPQRLEQWARQDEEDGRANEAEMHRQVWRDFVDLLDELVRALGTEEMTVDEFREALESALAEFTLGLAPPTLDQVLVGSIERSRHPAIKAALVLGFDEHHFPKKTSEDPLLGDKEREQLAEAGMEIGPTRRQQIINERMLAYIAMTRAGQYLWISYPRQASDGHSIQPSPYLIGVREALPGLEAQAMGDPRLERKPDWIARVEELGARLAGEFRLRNQIQEEADSEKDGLWNRIFNESLRHEDWQHTLRRCFAGLKYENQARLSPDLASQAFSQPFTSSVSRLEKFAACPFAHFVQYMLQLEERIEAGLTNMELGTICHAILERFVDEVTREGWPMDGDAEEAIARRMEAIAEEMLPGLTDEMMLTEARNRFLYERSRQNMARSACWQRHVSTAGKFRPYKVEFPFGYSGDSAAPLKLTTPKGREVHLRGKVDRVDVAEVGNELAAVVIDYKRTRQKSFNWPEAYHGLALQLAGYLLAIQQAGESLTGRPVKPIRPVAAFFLPLKEGYFTVAHPEDADEKKKQKLKGVIDIDAADHLGADPSVLKNCYSAKRKKGGEAEKNSDLLETHDFKNLFQYVGRKMGQLADDLIDGRIDVSPYRLNKHMPCAYCSYKSICRYEIDTQTPRTLPSIGKKEDVIAAIVKEGGNG